MLLMKRVAGVFSGLLLAVVLAASFGSAPAAAAPTPPAALGGPSKPVCIAIPFFRDQVKVPTNVCKSGYAIPNDEASGGAIVAYTKLALRLLNILIGGLIILFLVLGGIQYIVSAGDPAKVKNAKGRINGAITALILYLLMYAILNFLVPGGF
jgi:Type IV secretion system pilin